MIAVFFRLTVRDLSTRRLSKEVAVDDGDFRGGPLCHRVSTFAAIHHPWEPVVSSDHWIAIPTAAAVFVLDGGIISRRTDDRVGRCLFHRAVPLNGNLISAGPCPCAGLVFGDWPRADGPLIGLPYRRRDRVVHELLYRERDHHTPTAAPLTPWRRRGALRDVDGQSDP